VGQVTLVENRFVGMKSRGVYETPGGTILYEAHKALEQLCLERDLVRAAIVVRGCDDDRDGSRRPTAGL
jgi:argininosuccinate synthase